MLSMKRIVVLSFLIGAAVASLAAQSKSTSPAPPLSTVKDDPETTIKVDVNLVNILASVRTKNGALVGNLEQTDFKIFEDGKEQQIRNFVRETDLPLTIGLLVDTSKSQERLIDVEQRAASQFFSKVLRTKDEAFLIQFGAEAELLQDSTNSPRLLPEPFCMTPCISP